MEMEMVGLFDHLSWEMALTLLKYDVIAIIYGKKDGIVKLECDIFHLSAL